MTVHFVVMTHFILLKNAAFIYVHIWVEKKSSLTKVIGTFHFIHTRHVPVISKTIEIQKGNETTHLFTRHFNEEKNDQTNTQSVIKKTTQTTTKTTQSIVSHFLGNFEISPAE